MSAALFGVVVLAGGLLASRLPTPDPLGEALARVLRQEVAGVEPTITCTPDEEEK